jgi:hypothetical protein
MDFTTWGNTYFTEDYSNAIVFDVNSNKKYYIKLYGNYQEVELKIKYITILKFKDVMNNKGDLTTFTRIINNNQEYRFINGQLLIKKIKRKVDYLKPINKNINIFNNFITMDLETVNNNGILEPYCISIYDGKLSISFYLLDYDNS